MDTSLMHTRQNRSTLSAPFFICLFLKEARYIIAFLAIFLVACTEPDEADEGGQASATPPPVVRVANPQRAVYTDWQEFSGRFVAKKHVQIRTRVGGYLAESHFEEGQKVTAGDILFTIESEPFEIVLDEANARFKVAKDAYARASDLRASDAISQETYEQHLLNYELARAVKRRAMVDMSYTQIKAPFTGIAGTHSLSVGNLVSANTTILTTLHTETPIEFHFEGSEDDLRKYLLSSAKTIDVEAKLKLDVGYPHKGKLVYVSGVVDEKRATVRMHALFRNESRVLKPGLFGKIRLAFSTPSEALLIPEAIIAREMDKHYVYRVGNHDILERRYITLGGRANGDLRVVSDGLLEEDLIAVGSLQMLRPGMPITPLNESDAPLTQ